MVGEENSHFDSHLGGFLDHPHQLDSSYRTVCAGTRYVRNDVLFVGPLLHFSVCLYVLLSPRYQVHCILLYFLLGTRMTLARVDAFSRFTTR